MLRGMFPSHEWIEWKFPVISTGFFDAKENRRRYFDWCGKELGYTKMEDWYAAKTSLPFFRSSAFGNSPPHV
jgi:hypothetical protein